MADALLVEPDCFLLAAEFFQEHGEFDHGVGMVRFKSQGLGETGHGGLVLSQRLLGHAQVRQSLGILGVDFQRAAERVQGLARIGPASAAEAEVVHERRRCGGSRSMARPMSSIAASCSPC